MNDLNDFVDFAHRVARRYVPDPDDAADVAQDALMLAHRHRESFRGTARYSTWLYRIVATTAFSHLRTRRRRGAHLEAAGSDALAEVPDPAPDAAARVAAREGIALAGRAVDALGARYREVFWRRVAEEAAEVDVARELGLTVATVKVRTHRARAVIRAQLAAM